MTSQWTRDPGPQGGRRSHGTDRDAGVGTDRPAVGRADRPAMPGTDRPVARHAAGRPRGVTPARVTFAGTCAAGLLALVVLYDGPARVFPVAGLAVAALLVPALAVGVTVLRRLRVRRPPALRWCWAAAGWGLTAAAGTAALANTGLLGLWSRALGPDAAGRWGATLSAPLNEEVLKLSGVALLALAVPRLVRGPLDGFAVGALVGLGFQTTETWSHALHAVVESAAVAPTETALATATGRFLLVGMGSHVSISAVAGTAVGLLAARRSCPTTAPGRDRLPWAAAGVAATALAMHALLNAPLLATGAGPVGKALVNCAVAAALHQLLRRRLRTVLRGWLSDLGMPPRRAVTGSPASGGGRPAAARLHGSRCGDGPGGTSSRRS